MLNKNIYNLQPHNLIITYKLIWTYSKQLHEHFWNSNAYVLSVKEEQSL